MPARENFASPIARASNTHLEGAGGDGGPSYSNQYPPNNSGHHSWSNADLGQNMGYQTPQPYNNLTGIVNDNILPEPPSTSTLVRHFDNQFSYLDTQIAGLQDDPMPNLPEVSGNIYFNPTTCSFFNTGSLPYPRPGDESGNHHGRS